MNINKEFIPTVADTEGLDESKYKVVRKNRFVFSGMQTGRDECIRISMYSCEQPIIVSPAYTTFEVTAEEIILPTYFFMLPDWMKRLICSLVSLLILSLNKRIDTTKLSNIITITSILYAISMRPTQSRTSLIHLINFSARLCKSSSVGKFL